jgi:anti-anti-sigma regulatory factor
LIDGNAVTPLTLVRVPGPGGTILRCQGDLTVVTREPLRRDLAMLVPPLRASERALVRMDAGTAEDGACRGLVVNVSALRRIDGDGARALLEAAERLAKGGRRLLLVAARDPAARALRLMGIDRALPVCESEPAALALLNESEPPEDAAPCGDACRQALARWEAVLAKVGRVPAGEIVRDLGCLFALCEPPEEYGLGAAGRPRCDTFCPLPASGNGGGSCLRVAEELLEAGRRGDWPALRVGIETAMAGVRRRQADVSAIR